MKQVDLKTNNATESVISEQNFVLNRRVFELVQTQGGITRTKAARAEVTSGAVCRKNNDWKRWWQDILYSSGFQNNGSTSGQWVAGMRAVFALGLVRS